jgi:hypothetical protein
MSDRFALETEILNFSNVADDIDNICEAVLERDMHTDDIANALIGLSTLLRLRVEKTFDTFKAAFKLDEYSSLHSATGAASACSEEDE